VGWNCFDHTKYFFGTHVFQKMEVEAEEDVEDGPSPDESASAYIWKYFGITAVDAKKGGNKHAVCNFCARNFPACSTTRASAHILGRAVLGQKTAGINPCIPIKNKNDDRSAGFRAAQKDVAEIIRRKELEKTGKKRKQALMEDLLQPATKSVESSPKIKTGAKELDSKIASFFYENAIPFNVADSPSCAAMIEEAMTFRQQNPLQPYKVPLRRKLSGDLLDKAYESTEHGVLPILAEAKKYGATIASDGWNDVHRRPILNIMLVTRGAAVFRNSIDCTDHMAEGGRKNAAYIRLTPRVAAILSHGQCN
jgi:hypothetical protein